MPSISLTLLIPVYNEGENILKLYEKMKLEIPAFISWKALIVYDFPDDTTRPFSEYLQQLDSRIQTIQQDRKKGLKGALEFGFSKVQTEYVIVLMADGSDNLSDIAQMHDFSNKKPAMVAASRFSKNGSYVGGSFIKKSLAWLAGRILFSFGVPTKDPTNHFKMYSINWLTSQKIESQNGFEIALELTVKASLEKQTIFEIPTTWKDRTQGKSQFHFSFLSYYFRWFAYYFFNLV